jgi:putative SOS response-associated peptidase YedK
MCGRFGLSLSGEQLTEILELEDEEILASEPRFNIAPGQNLLALRQVEGRRHAAQLRWGLIPSWAKDAKIAHKLINARSETVSEKPSFRSAFRHRRCLVPSDGFYEWRRAGKVREAYHIGLRGGEAFFFGGLWESWMHPGTGEVHETTTILTTSPNDLVAPIHDRMPVIVRPEHRQPWLAGAMDGVEAVFRPYEASDMESWLVGPRVNKPSADDPQLRERQATLF